MSALSEQLQEIADGPTGPHVGAFFDLDGTLVAGFTANAFLTDQLRRREVGIRSGARTMVAAVDGVFLGGDPTKGADLAFRAFAGQPEDNLADLGERLFVQKIARTIRPQARELVRAHQLAGHTVVISSAATAYQISPIARDLGIEHLVCTELEVQDGILTGALLGRMRWGPEKARGVRGFAREHGIDLRLSHGYGNGPEDVDFLSTVGRPVALSPDPGLRSAARRFGWKVLDIADPRGADLMSLVRTTAAMTALNAGAAAAAVRGALTRDRRAAVATGVSLGCDTALRAAGVRIDATGLDILHATRPAVVIANHQSALDPLVMATLLRADFTIVAKREARWDPRAALATVLLDPVFIDRSNSAASRAALAEVTERIRAGLSLLIFPEGTRAPTPVLRPFRKGAFNLALAARVPIVPVVLRNTGEILPRHGRTIRPGVVDIRVLDPVVIPDADAIDAVVSTLHRRYAQTLAAWPQKESPHA